MRAGARALIEKPANDDDLAQAISALLRKVRSIEPVGRLST